MSKYCPCLWIVPRNDLEATEIIRLLEQFGERVIVSQLAWGASWERLEPRVVDQVEQLLRVLPDLRVFGVELGGKTRWGGENIDHHQWAMDDRSSDRSSIEQVADILGHKLNRYERLVAANDKGWIPALLAAGASQGEVEAIRLADRCAQGVTPDQEAQAVHDIAEATWQGRRVLVPCPHGSSSAITDRLYGRYDEALVCDSGADPKWIYYGPRARKIHDAVHAANRGHPGDWTGGQVPNLYAGFLAPSPAAQELLTELFWK